MLAMSQSCWSPQSGRWHLGPSKVQRMMLWCWSFALVARVPHLQVPARAGAPSLGFWSQLVPTHGQLMHSCWSSPCPQFRGIWIYKLIYISLRHQDGDKRTVDHIHCSSLFVFWGLGAWKTSVGSRNRKARLRKKEICCTPAFRHPGKTEENMKESALHGANF